MPRDRNHRPPAVATDPRDRNQRLPRQDGISPGTFIRTTAWYDGLSARFRLVYVGFKPRGFG